ncbi:MAG: PDZ domain-containing protein [Dehalogenimonas sp.]|uniref:PDZ domain-containing protein n=1 Tax=Candidatus Dehalogenimonas loeffleri TaxID=3127115 RepID=A0ABZ2JC27_9CHLR|nr:PDZ domain-containing protein [Dehalogenimonas sp.]
MAVPVTDIDGHLIVGFDRRQLEYYIAQSKAAAPRFGASVADAAKYTSAHGMKVEQGAYVGAVRSGQPAAEAGLKPGDIITGIDAAKIKSAADLNSALSGLQQGARVRITFIRDGQPRQAEGRL